MGSKNGFKRIHRMADLLGGMVGASRAAVNIGFAKYEHQVGQTGAIVRPKLYIACGISGAVQHLAGMSGSRYIIAINKDKNAPIFDYSDIAVIGDVIEILDQLLLNLPKIL
jgi:electron transfer flavoprotein alpha subunit